MAYLHCHTKGCGWSQDNFWEGCDEWYAGRLHLDTVLHGLPISEPGEIYIQFPPDWTWTQAQRWLAKHGWPKSRAAGKQVWYWNCFGLSSSANTRRMRCCMSNEEPMNMTEELKTHSMKIDTARKAIVKDLRRRYDGGDKTVKTNHCSRNEYDDEDGPRLYISGAGEIDCPICKTAKLRYSRAACNGHVHAACLNDQCVNWME